MGDVNGVGIQAEGVLQMERVFFVIEKPGFFGPHSALVVDCILQRAGGKKKKEQEEWNEFHA